MAREEAVRAQEGALGAREEAILAQELVLEIRASELSVGEDRLLEYTADLVREQHRHAREVEFLDTARDTLRWGRRALAGGGGNFTMLKLPSPPESRRTTWALLTRLDLLFCS